jgi:hypothetical protein
MSVALGSLPRTRQAAAQPWLRNPRWDLSFLILSIVLAALPYSVFLIYGTSGSFDVKGTAAYDARLFVNNIVALLIGGPHMYATFTRTILDPAFLRRRRLFIASTILVPIAVITLSVFSYQSYVWLLTVFFAVASLHALYQIIWLTDAYNTKARAAISWRSRIIDYGVVLTALYPISTFRMVEGTFKIGPVALKYHDVINLLPGYKGDLGQTVLGPLVINWNKILGGQYYLSTLAFLAFGVMLVLWLGKTLGEIRSGSLNVPKTLLIAVTAALMFITPAASNMDTAFQGVNTWHSFQYLALTWYANRLLEQKTGRRFGFMHWIAPQPVGAQPASPAGSSVWTRAKAAILGFLARIDKGSGWTAFYLVCMAMLPISGLLIYGSPLVWPDLGTRGPGADEVYSYMGILSILLVHYVQDALLFTDPKAIVD